MITKEIALEKVNSYFIENKSHLSYDIVIQEEDTIEFEYGWGFFYQSQEFIETGDILFALGGNAPIIINKFDGSMHITGSAYPIEKYLIDYIALVRNHNIGLK